MAIKINKDIQISDSNVSLKDLAYDYIVEEGTSGEFTYRKWNKGNIELWGTHSFTGLTITNANSGTYYGNNQYLQIPIVTSILNYQMTATSPLSSGTFVHGTNINGTRLEVDIRKWVSGTNQSCGVRVYVLGKWK